jgi:hypothetical protein
MKIGKYEFGLVRPFGWYGIEKDTKCLSGCRIYTFGPFFFTVLANECVELTGEDTEDCIVRVEPVSQLRPLSKAQIKKGKALLKKLGKKKKKVRRKK